jgi:hypothetical protein
VLAVDVLQVGAVAVGIVEHTHETVTAEAVL